MFEAYLERWSLVADGTPIVTHGSRLLPVRRGTTPAMLKIAIEAEEKFGARLMTWWNGDGAARVLAHDDDALLLERAQGSQSLADLARDDHDDEACRIICRVAAHLHAPRAPAPPDLIPLTRWFRDLAPAAAQHGGLLARAANAAQALLSAPQDEVVLHGDIHHGNILDFGARGWLAIDPKGLHGERGFDYANLFCNPDASTALAPGRLARRVSVVAEAGGLDRQRLLHWILAWSGLSAVWMVNDGMADDVDLTVVAAAAAALDQ